MSGYSKAWEFSVSHSGSLAVIAVTTAGRIGVDVELIQSSYLDLSGVARSFSEYEQRVLMSLSHSDATEALYRCWVRKEAFLKALGLGITENLDKFAVTSDVADARLLWVQPPLPNPAAWRLVPLDALIQDQRYASALAVEHDAASIRLHSWP